MWIWEQSMQMMSTFWKQRFTGTGGEETQFTVTNPRISSVSDYNGAYGSVDLKHHRYEVSYKKDKDWK